MSYGGLTLAERKKAHLLLREDTCALGGREYPVKSGQIGTPSDGDSVNVWMDASVHGHVFFAEDNRHTYDATPGGVKRTTATDLIPLHNLTSFNLQYHEIFRTGDYTLSCRFLMEGAGDISTDSHAKILYEGGSTSPINDSQPGLDARVVNSGGTLGIRFAVVNSGGSTMWDTGFKDVAISTSSLDQFTIWQDASVPQTKVFYNGSELANFDGTYSLDSTGTDSNNRMRLTASTDGGDTGLTMLWQGVAIWPEAKVGSNLIDYIKGNKLCLA